MTSVPSYMRQPMAARIRTRLRPTTAAVRLALCGMGAAATSLAALGIEAQETAQVRTFDIPSGPLGPVLTRIAGEAGVLLSFDPALVAGKTAPAIRGNFTVEQAVRRALQGNGLDLAISDDGGMKIQLLADDGAVMLAPVTVEGVADTSRFGDAPPEPGGFKAEYQTTATKSALSLRETPQAISVATRKSIDARQAKDITTALELTAGLSNARAADGGPFAGRGLGGGEGFMLRGQVLDGKRDVRMDGVVVSSGQFDLAPFERVEVLKGPAGFYGQSSLGGFINMVRKKPEPEYEARAVAQIGSFETYRGEADVTGSMNAAGTVLGRLTVAYENAGSFMDDVETRVGVIAPSIEVHISERTRAQAQVLYQNDRYTPSRGMPLVLDGDEFRYPDVDQSDFLGVPSQEESYDRKYLGTARLDHELSDRWLGSLLLSAGGGKRERFFDAYSNNGNLDSSGFVYMYSDTGFKEDSNWAGELRLDGKFDLFNREHNLLIGLEHNDRENTNAFGYTYLGPGNIYTGDFAEENVLPGGAGNQSYDSHRTTTNVNTAAFVQARFSVTDRTGVLVGIRRDISDTDQVNRLNDASASQTDKANTWRLGLTQDFNVNITGYALYSESFNPNFGAESASGDILDPETGSGYEVGVKSEWFDSKLSATVAMYWQELDNRAITDPNDTNFSINGGLEENNGIEVELAGSPLPGLTLAAAASWLDSEYGDRRDPNYGTTPDGTIEKEFALYGNYEIQGGDFKGFGIGVTYVNQGDWQTYDYFTTPPTPKFVKGYDRVDLNLSYKGLPDWDFSLHIRNLFDEKYVERFRDSFQDNFFGAPLAVLFRAETSF